MIKIYQNKELQKIIQYQVQSNKTNSLTETNSLKV